VNNRNAYCNWGAGQGRPVLNQLISPLYSFVYNKTGDPIYRDRADKIFAGGVATTTAGYPGGYWSGKEFSQNYRMSFDYVKYRGYPIGATAGTCTDTTWSPSQTGLCGSITQVSNCGRTRTVQGTIICSTGETCLNNGCVANAKPGDINGDGSVDLADLLQVAAKIGQMIGSEDVNRDGVINVFDLVLVSSKLGS
jgi:hypothetical protein